MDRIGGDGVRMLRNKGPGQEEVGDVEGDLQGAKAHDRVEGLLHPVRL